MCSNSEYKLLQLECGDTIGNLELPEEEYNRASTDLVYAQQLFNESQNTVHENENKENDAFWTEAETLLLISLYENHKDDFYSAKKRKHVWMVIAEAMIAHGYFRTAEKIERKWSNLMRIYRAIKDNKGPRKTGRSALNYKYYDRLDDILGDKPSNKASSSSIVDVGVNKELLDQESQEFESTKSEETCTSDSGCDTPQRKKEKSLVTKQRITDKEKRHRERIEIENKKIEIEQKVQILEKLLEKMVEEKK